MGQNVIYALYNAKPMSSGSILERTSDISSKVATFEFFNFFLGLPQKKSDVEIAPSKKNRRFGRFLAISKKYQTFWGPPRKNQTF